MPVFIKQQLSASPSGMPITVTATSAAGAQTIHQVQATATNVIESLTLWTNNGSTSAGVLAITEVTNGTDSNITHNVIGAQSGAKKLPTLIYSQQPLTGTDTVVHAYATQGVTFYMWGHVDRIATG